MALDIHPAPEIIMTFERSRVMTPLLPHRVPRIAHKTVAWFGACSYEATTLNQTLEHNHPSAEVTPLKTSATDLANLKVQTPNGKPLRSLF